MSEAPLYRDMTERTETLHEEAEMVKSKVEEPRPTDLVRPQLDQFVCSISSYLITMREITMALRRHLTHVHFPIGT